MNPDSSKKRFIISVGGSLMVPDEIDIGFIRKFHDIIVSHIREGYTFILVVGGGRTARRYIDAASSVHSIDDDDKDWMGIHATRMNAHLLRTVFREWAFPKINTNPENLRDFYAVREPIIVAGGWKPGFSTDYISVALAKRLGFDIILNLSNVDGVYDKDPKRYLDAKLIERITWPDFIHIVGDIWSPGMNAPFDPIAAKLASEEKLSVIVMNGESIHNLENYFQGKPFSGTTIE